MAIKEHKITMLGTGSIGMSYTMTLHNKRGRDRVHIVYSRNEKKVKQSAKDWGIPRWTNKIDPKR
jgi:predicted dehydrogenase